jgi:predicted Zn-dependent peptidase
VVPAPRLADAADVLADLFRNARFSQTDLAREKQVILEEIQMYRENPGQHVDDLLSSALWPGHPLGRLITGTPRSLAALTTADLRAWTDRNHTAANALVAVASPLDHHEVIALLIPLFSALPAGKPAKARRFTRPSRKPAVLTDTRDDIEQTHVALGFRTPGRNHHGRHALRLLSVALGETMGSRLFHSLREQRGLCYSINSETDLFDETGLLEIYTAVENSRLEAAMRALGTELNRVRTQPPRGRELIRAREFTLGQQALWFESTTNQMNWVAESLLNHPAIVSPESVVKKLLAVTPEHIAAAAGSILRPSRAAAAIIGPAAATSPLFSWLDLR